MANDTGIVSTTSSVLEAVTTSNENNTYDVHDNLSGNIWQWVWPLLCVTGFVGNTLVLLVLWRDGLMRTSANVYLTALAVGDNLVLMVASVAVYPAYAWGWWLDDTSILACHAIWPTLNILENVSIWIIPAFTAERCVAILFPLLKLRVCTPNKAGLCCGSLLILALVKNIELSFMFAFTINSSQDAVCKIQLRYHEYCYVYRPWINLVLTTAVPFCIIIVCNLAIIRQLRLQLVPTTGRGFVTRTTFMCMGVSFAFLICVVPGNIFHALWSYWPMTAANRRVVYTCLILLRCVNHAINFILYNLTGAHFRSELVTLYRSCTQRGGAAAELVRRLPSHFTSRFQLRRGFEDDIEMR
ncbi:hypothetical protein LSAT2_013010 [Lamellibrachia satsuma]|nr:hypothetical protein LSAT2_013010 [Lamellibrachia satsuma]